MSNNQDSGRFFDYNFNCGDSTRRGFGYVCTFTPGCHVVAHLCHVGGHVPDETEGDAYIGPDTDDDERFGEGLRVAAKDRAEFIRRLARAWGLYAVVSEEPPVPPCCKCY